MGTPIKKNKKEEFRAVFGKEKDLFSRINTGLANTEVDWEKYQEEENKEEEVPQEEVSLEEPDIVSAESTEEWVDVKKSDVPAETHAAAPTSSALESVPDISEEEEKKEEDSVVPALEELQEDPVDLASLPRHLRRLREKADKKKQKKEAKSVASGSASSTLKKPELSSETKDFLTQFKKMNLGGTHKNTSLDKVDLADVVSDKMRQRIMEASKELSELPKSSSEGSSSSDAKKSDFETLSASGLLSMPKNGRIPKKQLLEGLKTNLSPQGFVQAEAYLKTKKSANLTSKEVKELVTVIITEEK